MRLLRLLLLVVIIGVSYIAQSIFDHRHLNTLVSLSLGSIGTLGELIPGLYVINRMTPNDLVSLGMFALIGSSIGFGLVSTRWFPIFQFHELINESSTVLVNNESPGDSSQQTSLTTIFAAVFTIGGLALTLIASAQAGQFGIDTPLMHTVWLFGLLFVFIGAIFYQQSRRSWDDNDQYRSQNQTTVRSINGNHPLEIRPTAGWPLLFVLLIGTLVLYLWQLWQIPANIDPVVAEIGLQSLSILRNETQQLFFPGSTGLPMLAYVPSALTIQLTGDPLFGIRLAGVASGLLTVLATWLLCCELFRRVPRIGRYSTIFEDDGRWIALLAAVIVAFGHVTLHFSRLPVFLDSVAWGTLGLWSLLRGLRRQHLPSITVSGMMIGLSSVLYASGLFFLVAAPLWWIGVWLLDRDWFYAGDDALRNQNLSNQKVLLSSTGESSTPRFIGSSNLLFWLGGLTTFTLPFFVIWLRLPQTFTDFLQNDYIFSLAEHPNQISLLSPRIDYLFLDNLRRTFFTFNIYPNNGYLLDIPSPFLNVWLAPLLFLGLGALILNLDRLPCWLLLISFSVGIMLGAVSLNVPFWLRLLPIMPMVAIIIAFAIDRIRVALLETAGTWLEQTTVYLTIGFLIWTSQQGWISYYNYGLRQDALSSHVGRAIQSMSFEQNAILLLHSPDSDPSAVAEVDTGTNDEIPHNLIETNVLEDERFLLYDGNGLALNTIDFIASDIYGPKERKELEIGTWPETLPEQSRLLIQPGDRQLIQEIEQRYGEGMLTPIRNLSGDPVLYIYDIW